MEKYAKVTYSAAIIRRAVRHFWWRTVGWKIACFFSPNH
jgi:hypothetical protein